MFEGSTYVFGRGTKDFGLMLPTSSWHPCLFAKLGNLFFNWCINFRYCNPVKIMILLQPPPPILLGYPCVTYLFKARLTFLDQTVVEEIVGGCALYQNFFPPTKNKSGFLFRKKVEIPPCSCLLYISKRPDWYLNENRDTRAKGLSWWMAGPIM